MFPQRSPLAPALATEPASGVQSSDSSIRLLSSSQAESAAAAVLTRDINNTEP